MPPKRRIKHGSSNHSLPTLSQLKSATNKLIGNSAITTHNNLEVTNNIYGGGGGGGGDGGDDDNLTTKQQQQLNRNSYLSTLTKDQLKIECRKRGQKTSGNKMELLQRLGFKMLNHNQQNNHNNSNNINNNNNNNINNNNNNNNNIKNNNVQKNHSTTSNGTASIIGRKQSSRDREKENAERAKIVLWRHPILTLKYSTYETVILLQTYGKKLSENKILIAFIIALLAILTVGYNVPGQHQILIDPIRRNIWFTLYWLGLGVLSSVGLGTGLHTFILYLGPHIASVTLAAYECNSLDFPQPPYPDEIICPEKFNSKLIPTLWTIMSKVRPETILWGAGTALGELPPYFIAKSARLSGYDPDDADDIKAFEELKKKRELGVNLSILERAKLLVERIVEKVGFLGILACASIPNPLFDLAGITCGHFLVPFWTFFGATLIGKAVIKTHIQTIFVIIAFNESLIDKTVDLLVYIPLIGKYLLTPFKSFLNNQKLRLHRGGAKKKSIENSGNLISKIFELLVIGMVAYFIVSIVNSLAQDHHKRIHKKGGNSSSSGSGSGSASGSGITNNKLNHRKNHKD